LLPEIKQSKEEKAGGGIPWVTGEKYVRHFMAGWFIPGEGRVDLQSFNSIFLNRRNQKGMKGLSGHDQYYPH
jgi:hypothetical protein